MQALGLIETRGLIAAVEAADAMLKAAEVTLLEKTYVGGGLVSIAVTGGVAAVQAAVEAGSAAVKQLDVALLISEHVIPRPHEEINDLIVPIKPLNNAEIQNVESFGSESGEEGAVTDIVAEDPAAVDSLVVETILEDTAAENTEDKTVPEDTAEETEINASPEVIQAISPNIRLDEINKESIDKLVLEYGLEKALQVLSRIKLIKLRNLARKYESMGIKGRMISKADKKMILAEFKQYYSKN